MQSFEQFLESKNDTNKVNAIVDIAKGLQKVFKDYSLETRRYAWRKITSKKGEELVKDLVKTPSRSLSPFRALAP